MKVAIVGCGRIGRLICKETLGLGHKVTLDSQVVTVGLTHQKWFQEGVYASTALKAAS